MLVGGGPNLVLATPVTYPLVWGMGGNASCETSFGSECEATRLFYLGVLSTVASNFHKTYCGCCVRLYTQLCTIAILRMLPLLRPHPVGPWHGCMLGPIVHPAVRCAFFAMTQSTSRALNVEFIGVPCMLPFCVPRRYVWHCANGECNLLPHLHALYWHSPWVTGVRLTSRFL